MQTIFTPDVTSLAIEADEGSTVCFPAGAGFCYGDKKVMFCSTTSSGNKLVVKYLRY